MYKIDFLANHQYLIPEIARLKFLEFNYLVPGKTLQDFIEGLHQHCNTRQLPITWVVFEGKKLVGTFSLRECDLPSHKHFAPWLGSVLVVPEKRNRGIGAEMVKEAEKRARKRKNSDFYLFTPNKAAWYSKIGWEVIDLSTLNAIPITIMHKRLETF